MTTILNYCDCENTYLLRYCMYYFSYRGTNEKAGNAAIDFTLPYFEKLLESSTHACKGGSIR